MVVAMIIGAILEAIGIGGILPIISIMGDEKILDNCLELRSFASQFGINSYIALILTCASSLIFLYIIKNIYMVWLIKLQIKFALNNQVKFAGDLFGVYLKKPYSYHLSKNTAELTRNISMSIVSVFSNILVSMLALITECITGAIIWLMLIFIDPFTATIVAGLMAGLIWLIMVRIRRKLHLQGSIQVQYSNEMIKWLNQGLGAIKETKILQKEEYFLRQFNSAYEKYGKANCYYLTISQLPRFFIETLVTCGLLLLIIVKLAFGTSPAQIVPLLGVLALAAFRLMPCANRIVNLSTNLKYSMPVLDDIYSDLMLIRKNKCQVNEKENEPNNLEKLEFNESIDINGVVFKYPESDVKILDKLSFKIPKGSFVGIIGQSGAGKTTFVDVLLGLLRPQEGKIFVDGKDIMEHLSLWQRKLAYVPQSIYLIDGTIRENIALGVATCDIDEARIHDVLYMADLNRFIDSLPQKLDTIVGERGAKLSGGQRQRIGIARALYNSPDILILDEATAALDQETEDNITSAIIKLKGKITVVAIAHRIATLQQCDFKVQFFEGHIKIIKP